MSAKKTSFGLLNSARVLSAVGLLGLSVLPAGSAVAQDEAPETIRLTGIVRDFKDRKASGGHPDFEKKPHHGFDHFTVELHTEFTYDESANQVFQFVGNDDVWVFIDGQMVIDLGGVHGPIDQYIDVDRLELQDGQVYSLDFFSAERYCADSSFRITTNLHLEAFGFPTTTAAYD